MSVIFNCRSLILLRALFIILTEIPWASVLGGKQGSSCISCCGSSYHFHPIKLKVFGVILSRCFETPSTTPRGLAIQGPIGIFKVCIPICYFLMKNLIIWLDSHIEVLKFQRLLQEWVRIGCLRSCIPIFIHCLNQLRGMAKCVIPILGPLFALDVFL
jgi:hypothetical protein